MLAPAARLRRRSDFAATVRGGRRAARGAVVVHLRVAAPAGPVTTPTSDGPAEDGTAVPSRAGFVVPRSVGGAVQRNLVRRRLRHLVRTRLADLPAGTDLVVRALPGAATRSFADLGADLAAALAAAARRARDRS